MKFVAGDCKICLDCTGLFVGETIVLEQNCICRTVVNILVVTAMILTLMC
jgi:hypothetical protein